MSNTQDQRRAWELQSRAAHAHEVGAEHGQQEHLDAHEQSRKALEHTEVDHHQAAHATTVGHGIMTFTHDDISTLAHQLWQQRGCPADSSDQDWHEAARQLRARAYTRKDTL